jgi:hypothetical protein
MKLVPLTLKCTTQEDLLPRKETTIQAKKNFLQREKNINLILLNLQLQYPIEILRSFQQQTL